MAPVLAAKLLPSLSYPMDAFLTLRGKRILGAHKTVRGLVAGTLLGTLTFLLQQVTFASDPTLRAISWMDYHAMPWFLGGLFGMGAIMGDAIKSFVKRQLDINPGKPWVPFDQADWIIGMLIAVAPWVSLPPERILSLFITGIALHLLSKILGKALRLNQTYI